MAKRATIIVLDGVGIGEMPDADEFGDVGSNTLGNLGKALPEGLKLPNLAKMGLGNIAPIKGVPSDPIAVGGWGKCAEASRGKDTTTGHWEIAGVISEIPFRTYPDGFPTELIQEFEKRIGGSTIGNEVASGTEILERLGQKHVETGSPIVYTSADSVFQIAAHEEVFGLERLYEICGIAREMLRGEHQVGRVIARPFVGSEGKFTRTRNRKDYSVVPPHDTLLDILMQNELATVGVGKIGDIFAHRGLSAELTTKSNDEGILATLMQLNECPDGLIFTNLVDTDMIFGHRNDVKGFQQSLETFDTFVPKLITAMHKDDLLIITADHGVDPTTESTDHSREYTPLLVYSKQMSRSVDLGIRESFSDIAATILDFFGINTMELPGTSFYSQLELSATSIALSRRSDRA